MTSQFATSLLSAEQTERTITENLPVVDHHGEIVESVGSDHIRMRLPFTDDFLGAEPWQSSPDRVFSGPGHRGGPLHRGAVDA